MSWIGFLAPGGTPRPIIDRYNREIVRILKLPEVRSKLEEMEFEVVAGTPSSSRSGSGPRSRAGAR